jgi:cell division protein FtsW
MSPFWRKKHKAHPFKTTSLQTSLFRKPRNHARKTDTRIRLGYRLRWGGNLFAIPVLLSVIGLYFVFEASSIRAQLSYGDSLFFAKRQALWIVLGILAAIILSRIRYEHLYILAFPAVIVSIVLLVLVLVPGIGERVNGAQRWIDLGAFSFQPAEFVKLAVILYLSAWFRYREKKRIIAFIILLSIFAGLIMLQPDMGTAMIIALLSVAMYFVAGSELKQLLWLLPVFTVVALFTAQSATYRLERLLTLFDINRDPLGIGYHVRQIVIALQNGGVFGMGLGASKQKHLFLPEAHTDSIFAILVEETGFVGALGLITLYVLLLYHLCKVAIQTRERFGFMLVAGAMIFFALQSLLNLSAMTRLVPLTGVPLPFISSGGTNIFVSFCLIGICMSVARGKQA